MTDNKKSLPHGSDFFSLSKKSLPDFLTNFSRRAFCSEQNAITRKALRNQGLSDGGLSNSRRALPLELPCGPIVLHVRRFFDSLPGAQALACAPDFGRPGVHALRVCMPCGYGCPAGMNALRYVRLCSEKPDFARKKRREPFGSRRAFVFCLIPPAPRRCRRPHPGRTPAAPRSWGTGWSPPPGSPRRS